jgi:2Fe-2S ferredoxin
MSTVTVHLPEGETRTLECAEGWRLMEILRDWGIEIGAECGGSATCGQCRVEVAAAWRDRINPRTADEEDKLDEMGDVTENTRLACQILWQDEFDGLEVTVPQSAPV